METSLSIHDFSVQFGSAPALNQINLEIPRGKITVIMGPSGCGKTTLLRSLNRFLELNEAVRIQGEIRLDGQNIYAPGVDVDDIRTRIGLLAQRPFSLPMSIFDNVAYGLRIHGMASGKDLRQSVQHYLELAGLWEEVRNRLRDPAAALSIGQQQRLCLARGLAVEPEVILADEPTSALDPISAQHIEERLLDLSQQYTIVLVTHTLRQARRLADYVAFMYLGDLVEHGAAEQVFNHPQHARTQAYLQGAIG
ncbi:MAG TPA: phosphate ABC transporter ATP-binding protein [Bellilinea sp.]|jgi:phosphate transport system ATP-binding protein|nr:phosphate ABC transporter ATP-binding protein [Bellilinea sp.]